MGTMLILIVAAFVVALLVFITFEEKSLKNANFSDMKGLFTEERKPIECIKELGTVRYMVMHVVVIFLADLAVANLIFLPNGFGLLEIMAYSFIPAFMGSLIILLVKWTYQPVIKVISAMMYGFSFIGASALAFGVTYLFLK